MREIEIIWTITIFVISIFCFWRSSNPEASWEWLLAGELSVVFLIVLSANVTVVPVYHWLTRVIPDYPSFLSLALILLLMVALVCGFVVVTSVFLAIAADKIRKGYLCRFRKV